MFELPEAAHGLHLLQVSVEGQSAQTKAVAAVADRLQSLHLFNNGGHRYWWWDSRREFYILLARSGLITHCLLTWPAIGTNCSVTFIKLFKKCPYIRPESTSRPVLEWIKLKYAAKIKSIRFINRKIILTFNVLYFILFLLFYFFWCNTFQLLMFDLKAPPSTLVFWKTVFLNFYKLLD